MHTYGLPPAPPAPAPGAEDHPPQSAPVPLANPRFQNRHHAGRVLASWLLDYAHHPEVLVLALPRAIPVAAVVAAALVAPLDVFLVHPLRGASAGLPVLGHLAAEDVVLLNHHVIEALGFTMPELEQILAAERRDLAQRTARYRSGHAPLAVHGRTVILVDDGLSPGASLRVAVQALQRLGASELVVAAPVISAEVRVALHDQVQLLTSIVAVETAGEVPGWYEDLTPPSVAQVLTLLTLFRHHVAPLRERSVGASIAGERRGWS